MTQRACTTLVFVSLDEHGEREFSFVRKPGADYLLEKKDVDRAVIDDAKMVHFGMATLTNSPGRETLFTSLDYAKNKNKRISFDPNYRAHCWPDFEEAKRMALMGLEYADIVKMSETEVELFLGYSVREVEKAAKYMLDMGKEAVFITLGGDGAYYASREGCGLAKSYPVQVVDTTGCGDAFGFYGNYALYAFQQAGDAHGRGREIRQCGRCRLRDAHGRHPRNAHHGGD